MTDLYLIRHEKNIEDLAKNLSEHGLSPLGVTQAKRLRDRLAARSELTPYVLISSTVPRARQTAEIIAPALGVPIVFDDEIQQWRTNDSDTSSYDEFLENYRLTAEAQRPFFQIAPGAESWVQFMLRACVALNRITHEYRGKTIVIVCDRDIIEASFIIFFGLSTLYPPLVDIDPDPTSIMHWELTLYEGFRDRWLLKSYNDVMHLSGKE